MKLIFATHNAGKVQEMRQILTGLPFEILSAEEAGVTEDVIEDGDTFEANALKKARFVMQKTGETAFADDSGLCIEALNGQPGIYTARWAGEGASAAQMVSHTLQALKQVAEQNRQARFVSVVALVFPSGEEHVFSGEIHGTIPLSPRGEPVPKLPYDVIFVPEDHNQTFAEMGSAEKNALSHRGKAFAQLKAFLESRAM